MLELCAIAGPAADARGRLQLEVPGGVSRGQYHECRRRDVYLFIQGDQPLDQFWFEDPEITVICRADLLSSAPAVHVAAAVARMYREKGDRFVCELRGAFGIILYDHNSRTLKAWTDHFGVERLL